MSSPVEVKYVMIGGKQVEVKYELRRKKVDIFGLHKDKKNGHDSRKTTKNPNFRRAYQSNGPKRYPLWDGPNHSVDSSNCNQSVDSRDSTTDSVKSMSRHDKGIKNVESEEERFHKKSESIAKVADKLKKEKEPIRMENKFDKLMSAFSAEDFDLDNAVSISSKKNKKRNKPNSSISPMIDHFSDNISDKSEPKNATIAQNKSNNSSKPVDNHQELGPNHQLNNSYLFNNNSDDILKTIDNGKSKRWETQPNIKVFKNSIRTSDDNKNLINDFIDYNVNDSTNIDELDIVEYRDDEEPEPVIVAKVDERSKASSSNVQKNSSPKKSDKHINGELKMGRLSEKKLKNRDVSRKYVSKSDEAIVDETSQSTMSMWFFISGVIIAALVLYAIIILKLFCDCKH